MSTGLGFESRTDAIELASSPVGDDVDGLLPLTGTGLDTSVSQTLSAHVERGGEVSPSVREEASASNGRSLPLRSMSSRRGEVAPWSGVGTDMAVVVAESAGVCVRPHVKTVTDVVTGVSTAVPIPCGSTRETVCPSCAVKARRLRMHQCREGWHRTTELDDDGGEIEGEQMTDDNDDNDDEDGRR